MSQWQWNTRTHLSIDVAGFSTHSVRPVVNLWPWPWCLWHDPAVVSSPDGTPVCHSIPMLVAMMTKWMMFAKMPWLARAPQWVIWIAIMMSSMRVMWVTMGCYQARSMLNVCTRVCWVEVPLWIAWELHHGCGGRGNGGAHRAQLPSLVKPYSFIRHLWALCGNKHLILISVLCAPPTARAAGIGVSQGDILSPGVAGVLVGGLLWKTVIGSVVWWASLAGMVRVIVAVMIDRVHWALCIMWPIWITGMETAMDMAIPIGIIGLAMRQATVIVIHMFIMAMSIMIMIHMLIYMMMILVYSVELPTPKMVLQHMIRYHQIAKTNVFKQMFKCLKCYCFSITIPLKDAADICILLPDKRRWILTGL